MIVSQIMAVSKNHVIGKENKLPWHIPDEFQYFKETTSGKIMLIGRKTWASLPKPLPKRFHIIISRDPKNAVDPHPIGEKQDRLWVGSVAEALQEAKKLIPPWPEEIFILGGSQIYREAMSITNRIYLTRVEKDYSGDAFYAEENLSDFQLVRESVKDLKDFQSQQMVTCRFQVYEK